ncbi:MAG: serine/threonine-protein phosphatase [Pseudonocardia sp.]|nr:serine/threonine-protein phosphatase [Pseudonocardia sp.]
MPLTLRSAAGSDVGRRRPLNQDSAVTSPRLLAVADGMGGHAHGEVASSVAVAALADLDAGLAGQDLSETDLLGALARAITAAADRLTGLAREDSALRGTGTTVVALLFDGGRIGILHIGDSRAYLVRDQELHRLTRDHTLVQALVDEGRISLEEAAEHPRRSMLMRTLQDGTVVEPDLFFHEGHAGDRYLICSDGVTAVLTDAEIHQVLAAAPEPEAAVERLIELSNLGGGPDNITCVVADLVDGPDDATADGPAVIGAAAATPPR